jgi:hypothetical protein
MNQTASHTQSTQEEISNYVGSSSEFVTREQLIQVTATLIAHLEPRS